jgi:adenosylcobinamide-phosphate synthase
MMIRSRNISWQSLAAACALDWIAGDPHWFPHPVRWIGLGVTAGERFLRPGTAAPREDLIRGALLTAAIVSASWAGARTLAARGVAAEILLAWTALAAGSLRREATQVVEARSLIEARRKLSMIVGRDTETLDEEEIARSVIETVAESLCDGVVAPLFYLALGGVPSALAYKAVNTLDSMIGHPEPPYRYFGRVAARVDDAANWLPARMAAMLIVGAAAFRAATARERSLSSSRAFDVWLRDGGKHQSPNAGQTEAAMAGALGVRLGGLNYYGGAPAPKPLLGKEGEAPRLADARAAIRVAAVASVLACVAAAFFCFWRERR